MASGRIDPSDENVPPTAARDVWEAPLVKRLPTAGAQGGEGSFPFADGATFKS